MTAIGPVTFGVENDRNLAVALALGRQLIGHHQTGIGFGIGHRNLVRPRAAHNSRSTTGGVAALRRDDDSGRGRTASGNDDLDHALGRRRDTTPLCDCAAAGPVA